MEGFTAKITGLRELDAKLGELKGPIARRVVRKGLMAGGRVIQTAVQAGARQHVRPDRKSGTALAIGALAQDIELVIGVETETNLPVAIIEPGKYTQHAANWVEYGHRMVKGGYSKVIKVGKNAGKRRGPGHEVKLKSGAAAVPEHRFIRPAYEASREAAVAETVKTIAQGIEKAAKSGSGRV